jgi:hypothetical protein
MALRMRIAKITDEDDPNRCKIRIKGAMKQQLMLNVSGSFSTQRHLEENPLRLLNFRFRGHEPEHWG